MTMCVCMVGSEAQGNVLARAAYISPEQITVVMTRDDDVPWRMSIVTVHFFMHGSMEMVARAVVHDTQGKTVVLRVRDWDDMLGCELPSERPTAH